MSNYPRRAGTYSVGQYQLSGDPWITGSDLANGEEKQIIFPFVTKAMTIYNSSSNTVRMHFVATGSGNVVPGRHYFDIVAGSSFTYDVKCTDIYFSNASGGQAGFQLAAELTGIELQKRLHFTGSGISE